MSTIIKYICDWCQQAYKEEELTFFRGTEQGEYADLCNTCKIHTKASEGDRTIVAKIRKYNETGEW